MQVELDTLERSIYDLAGHEININSPQQLSASLRGTPLPPGKKLLRVTAAADELQRLLYLDPIIALILDYRERQSCVVHLLKLIKRNRGRWQGSYKL